MKTSTVFFVCMMQVVIACSFSSRAGKEMMEGERLYRATCRSCHTLPNPESNSDEKWLKIFKKHAERTHLSEDQRKAILKYLQESN